MPIRRRRPDRVPTKSSSKSSRFRSTRPICSTMQGIYPRLDASTQAIGNEAVGEIIAIGKDVEDLEPGNRVILLSLNNWREYRLVKAHEVVRVSPKGGLMQQSGLKVNPATASMLLGDFVELQTGDWIVQNAGTPASAGPPFNCPSFGYQDGERRSAVRRHR